MTAGDRFQSWGRRRESSVGQCSKEERNAGLDSGFRPNPEEDAERVARLRLQDEAEAAAKAQVFFQISHTGHELSLGDLRAASLSGLTEGGQGAPPAGSTDDNAERDQQHKRDFVDQKGDPKIYAA